MRHSIGVRVIAAAVSVIAALALARPAVADNATAGQRCLPIHHGTDEFAVCLYRDGPAFDDLPLLAPENAIALLDAFLAAPEDAVCVKPTTVEMPFVQCYFRRDIFEADEGNPAWSTMGPESDLAQAVLYSPNELTPLEGSEPTPESSPWPETPAPLLEFTFAPPPASDAVAPTLQPSVAPTTPPQPSEIPTPSPDPSAPPPPPEPLAGPAPAASTEPVPLASAEPK